MNSTQNLSKEEKKENIILSCKTEFIKNLKNFFYVKQELKEQKEIAKREIEKAKKEYQIKVNDAKNRIESIKARIEEKKTQIKDTEKAYNDYITRHKENFQNYNIIIESEEDYKKTQLSKIENDILWFTSKGYDIPAYLINEKKRLLK